MPVITFANTKGGAGKTTAVLLLSTELARRGYRVTIIDADPQQWISHWGEASGPIRNISIIDHVSATSLPLHLRENRDTTDYFIIDLPGARTPLMATAIAMSNHVLIPIQGCAMDAKGGAQVLELLHTLAAREKIHVPHSVVLTRVNSMVTTRALQTVKALLKQKQVPVLDTPIVERAAFRDIFDCGGTLQTMDPARISNLDKAQENAHAFADEILAKMPVRLTASARIAADRLRRDAA